MLNKTPEQRRASAAKGVATRRARIAALEKERHEAKVYAGGLRDRINALEEKLAGLQRMEMANDVALDLTGKALLSPEQIAAGSQPWEPRVGVYFLLKGEEVVYVGQSVNVYSRIRQHAKKDFDRYAIIPCSPSMLDKLESLYIHVMRPPQNGEYPSGQMLAPIPLDQLIG